MVITEEYFDEKATQAWFIFWLKIGGFKIGDEINCYDYMLWNSKMWAEFKCINGYNEDTPTCYIKEAIPRFHTFLLEKLKEI